jgi:glucokinase
MGGRLENQPQAVIGVDIGGTNIKLALVDPGREELLKTVRFKTLVDRGPEAVLADLSTHLIKLSRQAEKNEFGLAGVGVGCAGLIDLANGVVITSPNLPAWENLPLAEMLRQEIQVPVYLENDVNCICYGEYWLGAGRDLGDFLCIAPGTGVGGCVLINGRAWEGEGYSAGEVGHMTIQPDGEKCRCGNYGCLETLASADWLVRRAEERLRQGVQSSLRQDLDKSKGLDAEHIYRAAMAGDQMAQDLFHLVGTSLAIAIANVVHLLGLRSVLIGGGVANGWEAFIGSLYGELGRRLTLIPPDEVKVVRAKLGDDAGPLGGGYLAAKSTRII